MRRAVGHGRGGSTVLIVIALAFLTLMLALPLATVFGQALDHGVPAFLDAIRQPDALAAMRLTLAVGLAGGVGADLCPAVRSAGLVR
jgi:sulfate transport system permease protein